jgi:hypothetical protein
MVNQKCTRWAKALVDILTVRLGALYTVTQAYDASTDIYVKVALVAGGNNSVKAIIKLAPATAPASGKYDSLGLTQTVYTPHVASILFDITTPFSAGTTEVERATVDHEVLALGTRVEWYSKIFTGTNMVVTDIAAANFIVGIDNVDIASGALSNL